MAAVTLVELSKLRIGREILEKWIHDAELEGIIQGCFVRIIVGEREGKRLYRICVIKGFKEGDEYQFGAQRTTKYLVLEYGSITKSFKMDFVSNADFTDQEFAEWHNHMRKSNRPILTAADVDTKVDRIIRFVETKPVRQQQAAARPDVGRKRRPEPGTMSGPPPAVKRRTVEAEPETEERRKEREEFEALVREKLAEMQREFDQARKETKDEVKKQDDSITEKKVALRDLRRDHDLVFKELDKERREVKVAMSKKDKEVLSLQSNIRESMLRIKAAKTKASSNQGLVEAQDSIIDELSDQLRIEGKLQLEIQAKRRLQAQLLTHCLAEREQLQKELEPLRARAKDLPPVENEPTGAVDLPTADTEPTMETDTVVPLTLNAADTTELSTDESNKVKEEPTVVVKMEKAPPEAMVQ